MNKLIFILLFILASCKAQINNVNDYLNMKEVIDENIKNTVYSKVLKEHNLQAQFYITNLSSDINKTIKSKYLKEHKILQDGVYAFYIKRISYSYTHIYVKKRSEIKIFESVNCPDNNLKINQAIDYIKDHFDNKGNVVDNVSNYSKYIKYLKVDPQSTLNCHKQGFQSDIVNKNFSIQKMKASRLFLQRVNRNTILEPHNNV